MSRDELLKHVPPEVVYRPVLIRDEENALGPWQEAAKRLVEPAGEGDVWSRLMSWDCRECDKECKRDQSAEPEEPFGFPIGEDGERVRRFLDDNRGALDLYDEGIRRGKLQMPRVEHPSQWQDWVDMQAIRNVAWVRYATARALVAEGRAAEAGDQLIRILRMGEVLCGEDCYPIDHLVGIAVQGIASNAMRTFAALLNVPVEVRVTLLTAVEERLGRGDHVAECLCFEFFNHDLPSLDHYPEDADPGTLFDLWRPPIDPSTPQFDELFAETEALRPKRRQQFLFLLENHPRPFDKIATSRVMGRKLADLIGDLRESPRPWSFDLGRRWAQFRRTLRRRWLRRQVAPWPGAVVGETYGSLGETEEEIRSQLAELQPDCDDRLIAWMTPPTEDQLAVAQKRLRRIENPFGVLLASEMAEHQMLPWTTARCRDRLQELRGVLQESSGR